MRGFAFVLDILSVLAAAAAARYWWMAAGVEIPIDVAVSVDGQSWQPIADALLNQSSWNSYGASWATIAAALQAVAIIVRRLSG
jgi:hypothetical protein